MGNFPRIAHCVHGFSFIFSNIFFFKSPLCFLICLFAWCVLSTSYSHLTRDSKHIWNSFNQWTFRSCKRKSVFILNTLLFRYGQWAFRQTNAWRRTSESVSFESACARQRVQLVPIKMGPRKWVRSNLNREFTRVVCLTLYFNLNIKSMVYNANRSTAVGLHTTKYMNDVDQRQNCTKCMNAT